MSANLEMMQLFSTRSKGNFDSKVEVFKVPRIGDTAAQVEGAARDGKAGCEGEEDAEALRDAAHVHSGEADEDAQKPCDEQHEVLRCEP